MATIDPRVDAYIAKSADYAKPILEHLRKLVHRACPAVEETLKWSMPFYQYRGAILCNMAAFKQHCSFGFWNASLLKDPAKVMQLIDKEAAGHFGHIRSLKDLPADKILLAYIKEAAGLNEMMSKGSAKAGKKTVGEIPVKKKSPPKKEAAIPALLTAALKKNKKARAE
ncbi:MAG TPA: DUF1801 domain-containing protein [Puia sp.]|nr:DUF1801 domain-containing protein [Puia sp.]